MIDKNMNIVFIADIPQRGGASECLYDLVQTVSRDYGAECSVLFASNGPLKERMDQIGVTTVVTRHRGFLVPRPQSVLKVVPKYLIELVRYLTSRKAAIRRAEEAVDFAKVDIIHSNLPRNDLGVMLASKHGIPHVFHLREYSFEGFRCWSYRREPVRYLSDGANSFIAVSNACGNAWIHRGIDANKVRVVHDGIDLEKYKRFTRRPAKDANGIVRLLFLGGCSEAKGVNDAVDAIAMLPDGVRERVVLDIFGWASTHDEKATNNRISSLGLDERVCVYGPCDDIASFLANYDIGLVCSRSEAFCRVVVEYQAAGLAVIGSDVGSIPELLENGKRGRLYRKKDGAEALAQEIAELVFDAEQLARLQKLGPGFAEDFDQGMTAAGCVAVYEELVK